VRLFSFSHLCTVCKRSFSFLEDMAGKNVTLFFPIPLLPTLFFLSSGLIFFFTMAVNDMSPPLSTARG